MFRQDTIQLPHLAKLTDIQQQHGAAAIDIGGSVCKCAYIRPTSEDKEVCVVSVQLGDLDLLLQHLRDQGVIGGHVTVTGMNVRHSVKTKIETTLNASVRNVYENNCLQSAFLHLVTQLTKQEVVEPTNEAATRGAAHITAMFARACKTHQTSAAELENACNHNGKSSSSSSSPEKPFSSVDPGLFPCLLVCYGSGATFSLVTGEDVKGCKVIDGSPRGGKSFMALASLLLGTEDYDEVLSLAGKGSDKPLYQYMGDLRNGTKEKDAYSLFPDQMLIYNMGKAVGKQIDDFTRADLARALVGLCAGEMSHVTYWAAKASQCQRVFFCGGLLQHPVMQEELTKAFLTHSLFPSDTGFPEHYFLRHPSYLTALGGLMVGSSPGKP